MVAEPDNVAGGVVVRAFAPGDRSAVEALWQRVFPHTLPRHRPSYVLSQKLEHDDGLLFVAERGGEIIGTVMGGYDGHRAWLYSVAVDPRLRRQGVGRALVEAMEHELLARGAPKVNLQVRAGNDAVIGFYEALGYESEPHTSMGKVASGVVAPRERDWPAIEALLSECELTPSGLRDLLPTCRVARAEGSVVGVVALEPRGGAALLRSLAVARGQRGKGLGSQLVAAARALADRLGALDLYLLTETAEAYFEALGFSSVPRAQAPPAIRGSDQFARLCPQSAVLMRASAGERTASGRGTSGRPGG